MQGIRYRLVPGTVGLDAPAKLLYGFLVFALEVIPVFSI